MLSFYVFMNSIECDTISTLKLKFKYYCGIWAAYYIRHAILKHYWIKGGLVTYFIQGQSTRGIHQTL